MKNVAIIPARKGSKRLVNKNKLQICGKPLIEWTFITAKESGCFDNIILSSDDEEIISLANKCGIEVPFLRPEELASDTASSVDVVKHALESISAATRYESICLLQPTSVLRTSLNIIEAYELYKEKEADSVLSFCEVDHPIEWCNVIPDDLSLDNFIDSETNKKRSQDFPQRYRMNGAIYISDINRFLKEGDFLFNSNSFAYLMSKDESVDIDDEIDLLVAETILQRRLNNDE